MTTQIIYDHRGRAKAGQDGPVEIRVTHNRQSVYVNTGVRVRKSEFRGGEVVDRADSAELNRLLKMLERKALSAATGIIERGEKLDGVAIKNYVFDKNSGRGRDDMLTWMEEQLPQLDIRPGTRNHYKTMLMRLREFGKMTSWSQLSVENILDWDAWLHELDKPRTEDQVKAGVKAGKISRATVYNYHKCLKSLLNRALLMDKIDRSPYDKLKGKFGRGDSEVTEYLTEEEMKAVKSLHPVVGSMMAKARDLFVFQMETGLSYGDTQVFDFSEYKNVDGHFVNIGERVKTGVQYVTELSDECMEILGRYDMSLPTLCNQDYNRCLRALGTAAGIDKRLHSHMARHSFATMALAKGAKIENVSKMLGHTNITQTQRYAKILAQSVLDDIRKVRGK